MIHWAFLIQLYISYYRDYVFVNETITNTAIPLVIYVTYSMILK